MVRWINCPICGPRIKLMSFSGNNTFIIGTIEIKCRGCHSIICIYEDGKTKVLTKNVA